MTTRFHRACACALLFAGVLGTLAAAPAKGPAEEEFLPPEQAFEYAVQADRHALVVSYNIRSGYYRYRIGFATTTPGVTLGAPEYPKGLSHSDEYFGEQEIYRGAAAFRVPYTVAGRLPAAISLTLKLQGCADAGLCYPPQIWTTRVPIASAS